MNLRDKVIPKSDFQYSVNIDYDLNSEEKIKGYIPTIGGLSIIEDVMLSAIPTSKDRARLFVGAYGKGKSHLVLTILSLLSKKDKSLFTAVLEKAKSFNPQFYQYLNDYIDSDKKLLPVVIQGSSSDTIQTFLLSLKNALSANGLDSVLPDSYFSCAVDAIYNWKNNYQSTYKQFLKLIDCDIDTFISKLNMFDTNTYQQFIKLYPQLTSGSEFAPTKGLDIVKVYEDVAKKIKPYGFNGIFVVYDEFSKFLENSIGKTSAMEIKMIQDFAEMCNRSGENQLHLLLISHKHIQNYISQLPKEKVDAWKAVSERFKTIEIHNNFTQTYEIVSTVIQKDKKWFEKFKVEHKSDFLLLQESMEKVGLFADLPDKVSKELIYSAYPLDFSSLFILPRISELVAQNERTIFTFLASNQKNSLTDFINNVDDDFPLITPDYVYDYFEQLFRNENYNSQTFKIWTNCRNAISRLESQTTNPLVYKILKCIAIILILQQQDNRLTPTIDTITKIYLTKEKSIEKINEAFKELKRLGAINILDYNNFLSISKGSNIDVQKYIENGMAKFKNNFIPKDELNNLIKNKYLYPARYNDINAITRYFKVEFIEDKEILEINDWEKKISNINADGVVYLILDTGDISKAILNSKLNEIFEPRVVFVKINKKYNINKTLLKIKTINLLLDYATEEEKREIKEELSVYYDDCMKIINDFLNSYLRPELENATYINQGKVKKIKRKSSVSQLLSDICDEVFIYTPKINNELINKNNISSPLFNARNKVLTALLQNEIKPNLGLSGSGPEINIMRSTLFAFGILNENSTELNINNLKDNNIQIVIDTIHKFFISSGEKGKNFAELYDKLTLPKYKIGLKLGVVPIYIAVIFHIYKPHAVIVNSNDKEVEIKGQTLENINKTPSNYRLVLEDWNEVKQAYINKLDELFIKNVIASEREYNTFNYIVRAMQRWFLALSKYAKEADSEYIGNDKFEKLSLPIRKLKNQLRSSELNARELLFNKLPEIFGKTIDNGLINAVKKAKEKIDYLSNNTILKLEIDIKTIFNGNPNATINSVLKDWEENLNNSVKTYLFNNGDEIVFKYIEENDNNELELFSKLTKHFTGLRFADWDEETISRFLNSLTNFKKTVEEKNSQQNNNSQAETSVYKISYVDENGQVEEKILTKTPQSSRAQLLNNDITSLLEDFGESISTNEKRQVLLDILRKLN